LASSGHECLVVCAGDQTETATTRNGVTVISVKDLVRNRAALTEQIRCFGPDFVLVSSEDLSHVLLREAYSAAPDRIVYLAHTPQFYPFGPASWNPDPQAASIVRSARAIVAIGAHMQGYIREHVGCEAVVIHPPIDVDRFQPSDDIEDYYLVLARLAPYKRIDLAIEACKRMNRRLIIIGDGPDRERLEKLADDRIEFLGRQPDKIVNYYAARCQALLFSGEEDFGMVPLEVNAAGRPVIAYRGGGALETVVENITGVFFDQQNGHSLAEAIEKFEGLNWRQETLRQHAEKFDRNVFAFRVLQFLGSVAPASCADELLTGARLLSNNLSKRVWPRLALAG